MKTRRKMTLILIHKGQLNVRIMSISDQDSCDACFCS
jgi:hypothetical protein